MQLTRQKHPWLETNFSEGSVSPKKREETVFPGKIILLSSFHCLSALWRQEEKGGGIGKRRRGTEVGNFHFPNSFLPLLFNSLNRPLWKGTRERRGNSFAYSERCRRGGGGKIIKTKPRVLGTRRDTQQAAHTHTKRGTGAIKIKWPR